ncbi:MAG: hypothetical protein ACC642_08700 [Pseudomonadales bacterium]
MRSAIRRLVGAPMPEQKDEGAVTRRYMTLETVATSCEDATMDPVNSPPCEPAQHPAGEQFTPCPGTLPIAEVDDHILCHFRQLGSVALGYSLGKIDSPTFHMNRRGFGGQG